MPLNLPEQHICCIDDDPDMLNLIKALVTHNTNIIVHQFLDAETALQEMPAIKPSLILLDIILPEMNGLTAYHKIRITEGLSEVPVVFVTARTKPEDLEEYKKLGIPTIPKPFDPIEFKDLVGLFL